jgi:hypothetical protein
MLIKKMAVLMIVLFSTTLLHAQTLDKNAADLSGTWKLSKADGERIAPNEKTAYSDMTLKIISNSAQIKIEKTIFKNSPAPKTEVFTFYSDGRGESNVKTTLEFRPSGKSPFPIATAYPESAKSKTAWNKGTLITRYEKSTIVFYSGPVFSTARDEWKLSEDGKKLILVNSTLMERNGAVSGELFGNNFERREIKFVFERVN